MDGDGTHQAWGYLAGATIIPAEDQIRLETQVWYTIKGRLMAPTQPQQDAPIRSPTPAAGTITQAFATPVARITWPHAAEWNDLLTEIVLSRLETVESKFSYKLETPATLTEWGEQATNEISAWVLRMARQFAEKIIGRNLDEAFSEGNFNDADRRGTRRQVSVGISRSWASLYRQGDRHDAHFHPNTAIAAIYYVAAPDTCELDLIDPRPNIGYFDPGITFAGEDHNVRLRCKPGELLLFPGWLKHAVPEFTEDGLRISLSWNIGFSVHHDEQQEKQTQDI